MAHSAARVAGEDGAPRWLDAYGAIKHLHSLAEPAAEARLPWSWCGLCQAPWEYGFVIGSFQELSQVCQALRNV